MKSSRVKRIYVAEYNGIFKIGASKDVENRISQLSCACPTIRIVYQSNYLSNAFEIEKELHSLCKGKSIGGEWFSNVSIEEIRKFVERKGEIADYVKVCKDEMKKFSEHCEKWFDKLAVEYKKDERNVYGDKAQRLMMCLQGVKLIADNLELSKSRRLSMYENILREFGLPTGFIQRLHDMNK